MRTIGIATYPLGPFFDSPEEAIRHGESYGPLQRTKSAAQLLIGSQIIDALWTDTDFVIRFSNAKFLHIYTKPNIRRRNLDWRLVENAPTLPGTEISSIGTPGIELDFQEAGKHVMDCSKLMAARRGKDFKSLFVNECFFYVYTPLQLILTFSCVFRTDTGTNLLYICEDE